MLTREDFDELAALLVTAPTARNIANCVKALGPKRKPAAPKPPAKPRDHTLSRLRGAVTFHGRKVARIEAAHASLAGFIKGSRDYYSAAFLTIGDLANESSDRKAHARAVAELEAYIAGKATS